MVNQTDGTTAGPSNPAMEALLNQLQAQKLVETKASCPSCGYCPSCGRSNRTYYPTPYAPMNPLPTYPNYIWCGPNPNTTYAPSPNLNKLTTANLTVSGNVSAAAQADLLNQVNCSTDCSHDD